MAAYSGNKQRSQVSPQIPQDYSSIPQRSRTNETLPSPSFQPHLNHSPNPQMQQPQGHYANSNYAYSPNPPQSSNFPNPNWAGNSPHPRGYCGPGGVGFPSPQPHFTSGSGPGGNSPHASTGPGPLHGPGRGYPSPGPNFRNSTNYGSGPSPHFANSPGQSPGRGYPSPRPNFRNSPNHGPGQGGYPSSGPNQGRGYGLGFRNNMTPGPSFVSGRGRGSGQGGGRGRGHNHVTAEERPDRFFNKSMVEDPWKFLEPVIWKSLKKQWLPHSVNAKKPRVSESPRQSNSQPSLAEILAASFNETTDDEPNAE
ncbi:hypothetical protein QVD17_27879 [Tagetes erecta]|uniref:Uncharacterized protein n=1 Tax=Tagetes erecta TaxID=13708 RepID=A0AAD8KBV3_TARER|nr:hypothetical protein QVD17_27879 [Tagetes erecta]